MSESTEPVLRGAPRFSRTYGPPSGPMPPRRCSIDRSARAPPVCSRQGKNNSVARDRLVFELDALALVCDKNRG
jgi:hypothetical protein